ncbi:ribonuclease E inhibitor RraB [Luedemannella flava]
MGVRAGQPRAGRTPGAHRQRPRPHRRPRRPGRRARRPRPLAHAAYFDGTDPAEGAAGELRTIGFAVTVERDDEGLYALTAVRTDPVRPPAVHEVTWSVKTAADRHGGTYDGWSCLPPADPFAGNMSRSPGLCWRWEVAMSQESSAAQPSAARRPPRWPSTATSGSCWSPCPAGS